MSFYSSIYQEEQSYCHQPDSSRLNEFKAMLNKNSKSFLLNFPPIPFSNVIHGCYESNSQFNYGFSTEFDANLLKKHELPLSDQIVDILAETHSQPNYHQNSQQIDRVPILKRLSNKYFELGACAVLEEITALSPAVLKKNKIPELVVSAAAMIVRFIDIINAPISPLFITNKEQFELASLKGNCWQKSLIKVVAWHPYSNKFAVAFKNDLVKVYSHNQQPVVLKHPKQVSVTCLAWKPNFSSIIAVGAANCIIIWDTDVLPVSIKPSSSCSFVLSKRYHSDIVDLQWYPKSDFLLSVASKDNQIMIWDVTLKECMPIKRVGTSGFSIARFSPNGFKLFTADLSTTFRVWNPINYTSEKWTNLISRCNSACWSPDESVLLFSCHGCPLLYSLKFLSNSKQELQVVCDLSTIVICDASSHEEQAGGCDVSLTSMPQMSVGGSIHNVTWDPTGQRLAVTFERYENDSHINVVALFITKFKPQFEILPCGFINDNDNSWPTNVSFKPNFEPGALLTIAWSNARIQHVPFYFAKIVDDYTNTNLNYN